MKIREYLLLLFLGILIFVLVGGVTFITVIQRKALEAGIDDELLTAAAMVTNVLPEGYHDNISNDTSVSFTDYQYLTARLNEISRKSDLQEIWSVMVLDGKMYYTSSTSPQIDGQILENSGFLESVKNPEEYTLAFKSMQPQFLEVNNHSGPTRAVLIPYQDTLGRKYAVGVSRSMARIDAEVQNTVDQSLLIVGFILFISAGIGVFVANRLVWPIEKLTQTAQRIEGGDFSQLAEIRGPKELQDLGKSINQLLESNKLRSAAEEGLVFSENRYRQLFNEMAEGFALHEIITDEEGKPCDYRFLEINPAFENLTGLKRENLIGRRVLEALPGTESYWIESYGNVALTGKPFQTENYSRSIDKWVEVRAYCPKQGQFAVTFSDITRRKKAEEQLQIAAKFPEQNPNPVLRISRTGQVLFANAPSKLLLTYLKTSVNEWLPEDWKIRIAEIFAAKIQQEVDIECGDKIYTCNFVPILDEDYVNVYGQDSTKRKHAEQEINKLNAILEQRVRDRTLQLELSNKELEAFAYSVSHDLRAPLRGIDGWSQALQEDFDLILDAKGKMYLGRVREEARRMGQLIDDMLKLSRVSRAELKFQRIDLTEMAKNVIERIKENQTYHICEMQIQPGLFCSGDSQLLEIVLTNLLDNACKFSATRENPKVEFGLTKLDGKSAYFVRDNGVGFDMAYTQKLFGAFQRLHAQTEFPGTGIGLATVQRIIHRHGGTIWADALPNAGASFFFTLPEAAGE